MERRKISTLSTEEKDFATENHGLVYDFLHYNNYGIDEYYDIAVFGYLKAVQSYYRVEKLRKYKFSTIAHFQMKSEVGHHFTYLNGKRKITQTVSLDESIDESDPYNLHNLIGDSITDFEGIETKIYLKSLLTKCSRNQREVLLLMAQGYNTSDISKILSISHQTISQRQKTGIERMKKALTPITVGASA